MSYPAAIPAGQRFDGPNLRMAHALDILPTLLDYAGEPIPPHLAGMSLRPLVEGTQVAPWREYLFDHRGRFRFVRTQDGFRYWKLGANRRALYDLNRTRASRPTSAPTRATRASSRRSTPSSTPGGLRSSARVALPFLVVDAAAQLRGP